MHLGPELQQALYKTTCFLLSTSIQNEAKQKQEVSFTGFRISVVLISIVLHELSDTVGCDLVKVAGFISLVPSLGLTL